MGRRLEQEFLALRGYIYGIASKIGYKDVILLSQEDLVQEALMVLWRVLDKYPQAEGVSILKLFKVSFTRRLASLYRVERHKHKMSSLEDYIEKDRENNEGNLEYRIDLRFSLAGPKCVTPWDFYRYHLKRIEKKIGWKLLRSYVHCERKGKGFDAQKEVVLKNLE